MSPSFFSHVGAVRVILSSPILYARACPGRQCSVDLVDDINLGLGRVVTKKRDRSVAGPAFVVHARVNDESHRAPHFVGQLAELAIRVLVAAKFWAEAFAVERPTSINTVKFAWRRNIGRSVSSLANAICR